MVLSSINEKGGVGKTTLAVNLADALVGLGQRVLVCDMDPQSNASALLGVRSRGPALFDALVDPGEVPFSEVLVEVTPDLFLAPGSRAMAGLDSALRDEAGRERILLEVLEENAGVFDFIICDNAPNLGLPSIMSLVASDVAVIPLLCERLAVEGLKQIFKTCDTVKRRMNAGLDRKILLSMVDGRYADGKKIAEEVRAEFGPMVARSTISTSANLKLGAPIISFDPKGSSALEFASLAAEVMEWKNGQ